ncbi:hypothetical protein ZWY2020_029434 [Hordeum vulgare]|nr:hypothetical protein ZWY2020_029434 [Hordeum vulgare]
MAGSGRNHHFPASLPRRRVPCAAASSVREEHDGPDGLACRSLGRALCPLLGRPSPQPHRPMPACPVVPLVELIGPKPTRLRKDSKAGQPSLIGGAKVVSVRSCHHAAKALDLVAASRGKTTKIGVAWRSQ